MSSVKWDIKEITSQHSRYVDQLLKVLHFYINIIYYIIYCYHYRFLVISRIHWILLTSKSLICLNSCVLYIHYYGPDRQVHIPLESSHILWNKAIEAACHAFVEG